MENWTHRWSAHNWHRSRKCLWSHASSIREIIEDISYHIMWYIQYYWRIGYVKQDCKIFTTEEVKCSHSKDILQEMTQFVLWNMMVKYVYSCYCKNVSGVANGSTLVCGMNYKYNSLLTWYQKEIITGNSFRCLTYAFINYWKQLTI